MNGMCFRLGSGEADGISSGFPAGMAVIAVTRPLPWTAEQGWGFVTEKNRREQELLRLPELNSGFEPVWVSGGRHYAAGNERGGMPDCGLLR